MRIINSLLLVIFYYSVSSQNFPFKLSRINDAACETRVKVKDVNENYCGPYQFYILY